MQDPRSPEGNARAPFACSSKEVSMKAHKPTLAAALVASLAALGSITIQIDDNGPDHGPGTPRGTITFHVDRSRQPGVQAGTAPVQAAIAPNLETDLQNPPPGHGRRPRLPH